MVVLITYEDETITSPDERVIHFGYTEDVRLYGTDFIQRVRNAGFDVRVHVAFGKKAVRYGLTMGEKIFICRKTCSVVRVPLQPDQSVAEHLHDDRPTQLTNI